MQFSIFNISEGSLFYIYSVFMIFAIPPMIFDFIPIIAIFSSISISFKNSLHSSYFINFKQRSLSYLAKLKFHRVLYSLTTHYKMHFLNYVYISLSFLKLSGFVLRFSYFNIFIYRSYCSTSTL